MVTARLIALIFLLWSSAANAYSPPVNCATALTYATSTNAFGCNGSLGTVTSVQASGGTTGLTFSGGPITTSGTLTLGGTLAITNGGTGQTTNTAAFNALAPTSVQGDVLYFNGTNWVVLAPGTSGYFLETQGASANPQWAAGGGGGTVTLGTSASVTNPQRSGDATTGLFSNAASTVAIATGGTQAVTINTTGVAIGMSTNAPGYHLNVGGASVFTDHTNGSTSDNVGVVDVFASNPSVGDVIFSVGSVQKVNQFVVQDRSPVLLNSYGIQGGDLAIGENGTLDRIYDVQCQSAYIDWTSAGGINMRSCNYQDPAYVFYLNNGNSSIQFSFAGYLGMNRAARSSIDDGSYTDAIILPIGTTGTEPSPAVNGMIRYNSTTNDIEAYVNNVWVQLNHTP